MSRQTDLDLALPPSGMLPEEAEDLGLHVQMCGRRYNALRSALDRGHDTFSRVDQRLRRFELVGAAIAAVLIFGELGVTELLKLTAARLIGG